MKKINIFGFLILIGSFLLLSGCKELEADNSNNLTPLYDGKGMDMWETYLSAPWAFFEKNNLNIQDSIDRSEHLGWNNDTYGVFTEIEKAGEKMIRISGEVYGALISKKEYENYHLRLIFKWGSKKWPPRLDKSFDSGLLYHSTGPAGIGHNSWMRSNEFQIEVDRCGDFYPVAGMSNTITAFPDTNSKFYIYDPKGKPVTFEGNNWWCKIKLSNENGLEEWNTLDLYTYGAKSAHVVNGETVMRLSDSRYTTPEGEVVTQTAGKIQIQSEAAELFIKYIGIRKINEMPDL